MTEGKDRSQQDNVSARLISESIEPIPGTADPGAMARGEPGLPSGFLWRGRSVSIQSCERSWKLHRLESGGAELYLRRHYYTLQMKDGSVWTVYCLRQPSRSGSHRRRWYLYTIE